MRRWRARIKEMGSESILTPEWHGCEFDHITDDDVREHAIRRHLVKFWGLENPDVEWYVLKEMKENEE